MTEALIQNAHDLEQELAWFEQVLDARFRAYFQQEETPPDVFALAPPDLDSSPSPYAHLVRHYQLGTAERLALLLALIPHIRPRLLDIFFTKNTLFDRRFTEFGGVHGGPDGDFTPTGETLLFLLAGEDLAPRFAAQALFSSAHCFAAHDILRLRPMGEEPPLKAPLRLSEDTLSALTTGAQIRPAFGPTFPAQQIETELGWEDLVLHPGTRRQIAEIETWLRHGDTLRSDWGMAPRLRPGYRSLFYGPPGTGKTMTACLLGKETGRAVYGVDLALVVSKYIGETEKNLAKVFDQAQRRGWVLFFDEADALFGTRSEAKDAQGRYANQEIAFLLQRIERFDGVAILASNRREQLDPAFARRFESVIYFPLPGPEERLRLWSQGFAPCAQMAEGLDLAEIARAHPLAGGAIMNVIRYASLQALGAGRAQIAAEDVQQGIRREYAKESRRD